MPSDVRSRRTAASADPESLAGGRDDDDDDNGRGSFVATLRQMSLPSLVVLVLGLMLLLMIYHENPHAAPLEIDGATSKLPQVDEQQVVLPSSSPEPPPPTTTTMSRLAEWRRHPLQQEAGLPPGPERMAPEPSSQEPPVMVQCATTTGPITIEVHLDWAPKGAARFLEMVRGGFFSTKVTLFRSVKGFICQTGIAGDPHVQAQWKAKGTIGDDKQWLQEGYGQAMKRGYLSFAGGGPNTRGVEFFFSYRDVGLGSSPWEVPFGKLVGEESYQNMDHWYTGYGDIGAFGGHAPSQGKMYDGGVKYVEKNFPEIDYITACDVLQGVVTE